MKGMKRNHRLTINLLPAVAREVKQRAEEEGMSASKWIAKAVEFLLTTGVMDNYKVIYHRLASAYGREAARKLMPPWE